MPSTGWYGRALSSALYGVIAFWFMKLALGIGLVAATHWAEGNVWALMLLPVALASGGLAAAALRQLALLMRPA